ERKARKEVRSPLPGPKERLLPPPRRDPAVIAGDQDLRNPQAPKLRGPRILRILEKSTLKALGIRRFLDAEHARHQARARVDHHERRQFSPGEHEVAQGKLLVYKMTHPLVHSFVAPADEYEAPGRGVLPGHGLVEAAPGGVEEDDAGARQGGAGVLDRLHQRLDLHHHAGAAAVGGVVGDAMLVVGVLPQVAHPYLDQAAVDGLAEDALLQGALHEARKEGDDLEDHPITSGGSTTTLPSAIETSGT